MPLIPGKDGWVSKFKANLMYNSMCIPGSSQGYTVRLCKGGWESGTIAWFEMCTINITNKVMACGGGARSTYNGIPL